MGEKLKQLMLVAFCRICYIYV